LQAKKLEIYMDKLTKWSKKNNFKHRNTILI